MRRLSYFIILISGLYTSGYSQTTRLGGYAGNGQYIGFLQFLPQGYASGSVRYPLIISLHGLGEKGNGTTELQKVECCGIPAYIKAGNQMQFSWNGKTEKFIVLTPQLSPKYFYWQNFYVDELIKYALRSLKVDPDRIFLTGLSLGGGGTWTYASTSLSNANNLAGIVPVVAPCSTIKDVCVIAKAALPVFALHALDDTVALAQCTINAIRQINNCHALPTPNVILYPKGGHVVFFRQTYDTSHRYQDPNVFEWMLAQNRKLPPNRKPVARLSAACSITNEKGLITLDGTGSYDPDGKLVSCSWARLYGPQPGTLTVLQPGKAEISGLTLPGKYTFLIKVVDDRAEWSTDTLSITLSSSTAVNLPPVANAGQDIYIAPGQTANLDAIASADPDGTITGYQWSMISGPSEISFTDAHARSTTLRQLEPGIYQVRLYVVDNKGAISTDVVQITVGDAQVATSRTLDTDQGPLVQTTPGNGPDPIFRPLDTDSAGNIQLFIASIYPNPVANSFSISMPFIFSGNATVCLYDITGNLIEVFRTSMLQNLRMPAVPAGIYQVQILCGNHPAIHAQLIKK